MHICIIPYTGFLTALTIFEISTMRLELSIYIGKEFHKLQPLLELHIFSLLL